jgi:flagellar basal-body rod protein FlgG
MDRAMYASASGMAAQQQNLDVVADNLANADVVGFKSAQATFAPIGPNAMLGTVSAGVREILSQGKLERSGGPFDVALQGAGFFVVERDGALGYTRAGSFSRASDGSVCNAAGWKLRGVRIPSNAQSLSVAADGLVSVDPGDRTRRPVGHIELATFDAPENLRVVDGAVFGAGALSGRARMLSAGEGKTTVAFGMLEKSNVSIVESMMAILAAQRAYEANAKGVQAADEMLRIANNLHRS